MRPESLLDCYFSRLRETTLAPTQGGTVQGLAGGLIEASGLRVAIGDVCTVINRSGRRLPAEVVSVSRDTFRMAPFGTLRGLTRGDSVLLDDIDMALPPAESLMGRVVDARGRILDGGPPPGGPRRGSARLEHPAPSLSERRSISRPLATGVAAVDGLLTLCHGQRMGVFAGSGVGKSTLMQVLLRQAQADRIVLALIGERGREVQEFYAGLGEELRQRTIIVASTSDAPPALRMLAPKAAIALSEELRDDGHDVLIVIDSITRYALAAREVSITAGEPPSSRGFPPSVFARLPLLLERLGCTEHGSITGLMTVLVEGDRIEEDPLSDALRGLLDGHLVLSRELAERGHYPAIDVPVSVSRTMSSVTTPEHDCAAARVRVLISALRRAEELLEIGALRLGADPLLDEALSKGPQLREFLIQGTGEKRPFPETMTRLAQLAATGGTA